MRIKNIASIDEIQKDLERLKAEYPQRVAEALYNVVDDKIMSESRRQCPYNTGQLRRSAHTNEPEVIDGVASITFGYGTDYAIYVHEILENYHKPPTKAKFLEDPVLMYINDLPVLVLDEIDRIMGV